MLVPRQRDFSNRKCMSVSDILVFQKNLQIRFLIVRLLRSFDKPRSSRPRHRWDSTAAPCLPVSNRRSDLRMLDRCASDRPGKRMGARWRNIGPDLPL